MTQLMPGKHTIYTVGHLVQSNLPGKALVVTAGALTSRAEAMKVFNIINRGVHTKAVNLSCLPQEQSIVVVGDKAYFDVDKTPFPTSMISATAEEAIALYVEMLIKNRTVDARYVEELHPKYAPVSSVDVPTTFETIDIAADYGLNLA